MENSWDLKPRLSTDVNIRVNYWLSDTIDYLFNTNTLMTL